MTEQQQHLKSVIEQQKALIDELQKLTNDVNVKREMAIKLQGIIEYLTGTGVSLPEEESPEESKEESKSE
jgi:hypothetical protein